MVAHVADFLVAGLAAGQGGLVLTSDARWDAIQDALHDLGVDVPSVIRAGALLRKDGSAALARLVEQAFDPSGLAIEVRPALDAIRAVTGNPQVLAFGDMVDTLWAQGQTADAVRLEHAWHELLKTESATMLCAYRAGALDTIGDPSHLLDVCRMHGHIVAVEGGDARRDAIRHGLEMTLGSREIGRLELTLAGAGLPAGTGDAETALLWLRTQVPRLARRVMLHAETALAGASELDG